MIIDNKDGTYTVETGVPPIKLERRMLQGVLKIHQEDKMLQFVKTQNSVYLTEDDPKKGAFLAFLCGSAGLQGQPYAAIVKTYLTAKITKKLQTVDVTKTEFSVEEVNDEFRITWNRYKEVFDASYGKPLNQMQIDVFNFEKALKDAGL